MVTNEAQHAAPVLELPAAAALPMLPISDVERSRAVRRGCGKTVDHDLSTPVTTWAEHHAALAPNRLAVWDTDGGLSYRDLTDRARRLAGRLAEAGAAGRVVAVGGPRGADVIVAFLAIELVGAIYLPLELSWPASRLADVLTRAGAAIVLVAGDEREPHAATASGAATAGCPVFSTDASREEPWRGRPRLNGPEQIRYVLFTSGSTGAPKGAVVEHRGMLNHLWCKVEDLGLTSQDRTAQSAPLGFDISVWQMLAPLLVGGRVDVLTDDVAQSPVRLADAVDQRSITVLEVVPTMLRLLADDTAGVPNPTLRCVLATGEELLPDVARAWSGAVPHARLINAYGPTECSDDVTHHEVTDGDLQRRRMPIGGPVANMSLYVLSEDAHGWRACEPGEQGELFVGGVGVGRGYIGDPQRTSDSFFQDPFAQTPTGRLYRTGDVVRLTGGGILEYLGRADRQVKIGGVRMELGEIESVLQANPAVSGCAVRVWRPNENEGLIARETTFATPTAPPRLVAYVCGDDDGLDATLLREFCARQLPPAMVASIFVRLPELPLTRNGKIDYAALPEPTTSQSGPDRPDYDPPRGRIEAAIADAIGQVLGVRNVGRGESFLHLGGDSLRAMRVAALLGEHGHRVTVRDVVLEQTPRMIASAVQEPSLPTTRLPRAVASGRRRRRLTPFQESLYRGWQAATDNPAFSYQGTLRLSGPLDLDRLADVWAALLEENPVLRAGFVDADEPQHEFPVWEIPLPPPTDLSRYSDAEGVYRHARQASATRPFDLAAQPALRVELFAMGAGVHNLLITMHEIVLDGWGVTVLIERLAQLYGSGHGPIEADPARGSRYDHYLDWQSRTLEQLAQERTDRYWRDQLAGTLPALELPAPTRPERPTHRAEVVERLIEATELQRVRALCRASGCTPFMVLLAAYALALREQGKADDLLIGAPIANRDTPEQSDVLAFLLNVLPLRVRIDPADTGRAYLMRLRDVVLAGYAHSGWPLAWMRCADGEKSTEQSTDPPFEAVFNLLTYPARRLRAGGVDFAYTVHDPGYAKFGYAVYGQEHGTDGMVLQLVYRVDALRPDAAEKLMDDMMSALQWLLELPDTLVGDLSLPSHG